MKSKLHMNGRRPTYHIVFNKLTYFLSVFAVLTYIIGGIIGLTYGLSAKYWEGSGSRPPIENACADTIGTVLVSRAGHFQC